jgi:hypothetical protein
MTEFAPEVTAVKERPDHLADIPDWMWPIIYRDHSAPDFFMDQDWIQEFIGAKQGRYFLQIVRFKFADLPGRYHITQNLWLEDPDYPLWHYSHTITHHNATILDEDEDD